jgi:hypothetical protein
VDLATTVLIGVGTVVSVVFGSSAGGPDVHYNVQVIVDLFDRTIVYVACGVLVGVFAGAWLFLRWTVSRGAARSHFEHKMECFTRALCAGLFSGTTGFLTKSTVVCITNMWNSHDASDLKRWELYCFVFGLPCECRAGGGVGEWGV